MKDLVRRGYDSVSTRYRGDDECPVPYREWCDAVIERVRPGARVLDLGCGCGIPMARDLAAAGCDVVGVDLSDVQITRARALVPAASFVRADITDVAFAASSFDAVVCLYSIIHVPLVEQPGLLVRVAEWLRPGGWLLLIAGESRWTGVEEQWLGGDAPMWWDHADRATYREWLVAAGFDVVSEEFVPEGAGGHSLFWARR